MRYKEFSHRHGKELLGVLHPTILQEIIAIIETTDPFTHGAKKGFTVKDSLTEAFLKQGWTKEGRASFKTDKKIILILSSGKWQ